MQENNAQMNILMIAVMKGNFNMVKFICERFLSEGLISLQAVNKFNQRAIDIAIKRSALSVLTYLVEYWQADALSYYLQNKESVNPQIR